MRVSKVAGLLVEIVLIAAVALFIALRPSATALRVIPEDKAPRQFILAFNVSDAKRVTGVLWRAYKIEGNEGWAAYTAAREVSPKCLVVPRCS